MAYPIGDMCQQISLEYVNGDPDLDVALLRLKGVGSEVLGPHFELLTRAMQMNEAELEMIGFSQLSAILEHNKMEEVRKLPGLAGGHDCTGQPQPYNFKPQRIHDQMIEASTSDYLRVDAHLGDSGSPIFLEDGRVGGLVTEVDLGLRST